MLKKCNICKIEYKTYRRKQKTCGKRECILTSKAQNNPPISNATLKGLREYNESIKGKSFEEIHGPGSLSKHKLRMKGMWSKDWFIEKYGEEEGIRKYQVRCKKISRNSHFRIYNKKNRENYSNISQDLFWSIYNQLNLRDRPVYFASLNHEFSCHSSQLYDFVLDDVHKVIEFNGDYWHGNPTIYSPDDVPNISGLTATELWAKDKEKNLIAENNGYKVLTIWEKDYRENSDLCLSRCVAFLV